MHFGERGHLLRLQQSTDASEVQLQDVRGASRFDFDAPVERVTLPDMPIPYAEPLESAVLPNAHKIAAAAKQTLA